jgi:hypothetical protein
VGIAYLGLRGAAAAGGLDWGKIGARGAEFDEGFMGAGVI